MLIRISRRFALSDRRLGNTMAELVVTPVVSVSSTPRFDNQQTSGSTIFFDPFLAYLCQY